MNGTRLFDEDVPASKSFQWIETVKVKEPERDWSELYDQMVEWADTGCWEWKGKIATVPSTGEKNRIYRDVRRVLLMVQGNKNWYKGKILTRCQLGNRCVNPQHYILEG